MRSVILEYPLLVGHDFSVSRSGHFYVGESGHYCVGLTPVGHDVGLVLVLW